ncbi:hypothetical protein FOE78_03285 [Microlunatus elymi]|uniref:Uncharacterized protein n=1 Tax=Microlunatus elymi TaxID=2596828 RepID=A0A516PV53_9ACTN|nr:hypothetical protein [Microlunatus elymi]QDP95065.1 hypothetical protein FOE78_03285 [Microlunatus elymi]
MISILSGVIPAIISAAGGVIVLILVLQRCAGRARTSGLTGAILLLASPLTQLLYSVLILPWLAGRVAVDALRGVQVVVMIEGLLTAILFGTGLLLLVRCVRLSHRDAPASPVRGAAPNGSEQRYPPNPYA